MRIAVLCFIALLFLSCNKERRLNRHLQGTWEVNMVKLQDADGFSFFDYNPSGVMMISNESVQGELTSSFQTFQGLVLDTLALQGSYWLNINDAELNWVQTSDTIKNRIFVITNKNLEIEYYNAQAQKRLRYVFKKVN